MNDLRFNGCVIKSNKFLVFFPRFWVYVFFLGGGTAESLQKGLQDCNYPVLTLAESKDSWLNSSLTRCHASFPTFSWIVWWKLRQECNVHIAPSMVCLTGTRDELSSSCRVAKEETTYSCAHCSSSICWKLYSKFAVSWNEKITRNANWLNFQAPPF